MGPLFEKLYKKKLGRRKHKSLGPIADFQKKF